MRQLDVLGVRVDTMSKSPILLLAESGGQRVLPIWIGAQEAAAIAQALEGVVPQRPLTHDLMAALLALLPHQHVEARITGLQRGEGDEGGIFLAELVLDGEPVPARPSDVVALAVRSGIQISAPQQLIDEVGIVLDEPAQDEVERFRAFLDQVSPDDFEGPEQ